MRHEKLHHVPKKSCEQNTSKKNYYSVLTKEDIKEMINDNTKAKSSCKKRKLNLDVRHNSKKKSKQNKVMKDVQDMILDAIDVEIWSFKENNFILERQTNDHFQEKSINIEIVLAYNNLKDLHHNEELDKE